MALIPIIGFAHPHTLSSQRANLVVAKDKITVRLIIKPSPAEGARLLASIDTNNNQRWEEEETAAAASQFTKAIQLKLNGNRSKLPLKWHNIEVKHFAHLTAGHGEITLEYKANSPLTAGRIELSISDQWVAAPWFIQPWLADDMTANRFPKVIRAETPDAYLALEF